MSRVVIFTRADAGVTIRRMVPNGIREGETETDYLNRLVADAVASGKAVDTPAIIEESALPDGRADRNAWQSDGNTVVVPE